MHKTNDPPDLRVTRFTADPFTALCRKRKRAVMQRRKERLANEDEV